ARYKMQMTDGEPDTLRDVSPVRGGAFGNLSQQCEKALGAYSTSIDSETYFVAHSLGCITLLSYLNQLNTLPNFGGFILVSGFSEFIPTIPSLASFTEEIINYKKINAATKSRVVVAAKDDSIVPFQFSQSLSNQLDASFCSLEKGGHFLEDDGFTTFPLVYNTLHTMMKK
ncbi:alpha/beta hydrolase, partial [Bacillus thuringiensis]|uniref:RBBP9/YdeN family alpha/beta hydrolase n=1 Tax=Bacillus thuringiensis TaxID=1428 RepID=UPI003458A346